MKPGIAGSVAIAVKEHQMISDDAGSTDKHRNILVFADGTGNEGGLLPDESRTNVYKLYRATRVDPTTCINPADQIAFYIPGIGTPEGASASLARKGRDAVESAVGIGLSGKIIDCYVAIIGVWRPGDHIYLFGFSRGAYTVRCLAHVLEQLGIPTCDGRSRDISLDPKKLRPIARAGVGILYRLGLTTKDDAARDARYAAFRQKHRSQTGAVPYFMGVWDTVGAIGWNRIFPGHDEKHLPKGIQFVRHAMAIDEYRLDYQRAPWGSSHTIRPPVEGEPMPFKQVWFAGNHADIGGSYPENESRLSDITLKWMVDFITSELPPARQVKMDDRYLNLHPASNGMMHDELMDGIEGSGVPWLKKIRPVDPAGELHQTVLDRLALPAVRNFDTYGPYRPVNLKGHPAAKPFFERSRAS